MRYGAAKSHFARGVRSRDLGGAKIAYLAYQKSLEGKARPADIDGFTPEQQFFIAWGQFRGDEIRIEAQRLMMQTDPHPVAKYRVIGPLSSLPEFQQAWSCKSDATWCGLKASAAKSGKPLVKNALSADQRFCGPRFVVILMRGITNVRAKCRFLLLGRFPLR